MRLRISRTGKAVAVLAALSGTVLLAAALPASAQPARARPTTQVTSADWSAYLNGPAHSSFSPGQRAISPSTTSSLVQKWHFTASAPTKKGQPGPGFFASPTVADGAVFIGSDNGWFYKLSEATGAVLAKIFLGYQPKLTCAGMGVVDTATVAPDPVTHEDTVYVGGPDGYLYALKESDLVVKWKSVIAIPSAKESDYFEWSSPTVTRGRIYIGAASNCDVPLIHGGVYGYDQATGKRFAQFFTVPKGVIGGSVWSSVAAGPGGDLYATTGNGVSVHQKRYYTEAIIKLSPTLHELGFFQVPLAQAVEDSDFGGSPTIFGNDVGACNKNGTYYVLNRNTMALAWEDQIGGPASGNPRGQCSAAAAYDGRDLFLGAPATTVGGTAYDGSLQERDPRTGQLLWETGLLNGVLGSPSLDGAGILAAGTFGSESASTPDAFYLVNAATGAIVRTLIPGSLDFSQPVFADGWLFTANGSGLYAWGQP